MLAIATLFMHRKMLGGCSTPLSIVFYLITYLACGLGLTWDRFVVDVFLPWPDINNNKPSYLAPIRSVANHPSFGNGRDWDIVSNSSTIKHDMIMWTLLYLPELHKQSSIFLLIAPQRYRFIGRNSVGRSSNDYVKLATFVPHRVNYKWSIIVNFGCV